MRRSEKWGKKSSQNIIFFKKAFFGLFLNFQQLKTKGEREKKNRKQEGKDSGATMGYSVTQELGF